jgi:hypothetical protein
MLGHRSRLVPEQLLRVRYVVGIRRGLDADVPKLNVTPENVTPEARRAAETRQRRRSGRDQCISPRSALS